MSDVGLPSRGELLRLFAEECDEHLSAMREGLRVLESDPDDAGAIESVCRATHTIKGDSGMLGLAWLQSSARVLESLLDRMRSQTVAVSDEHVCLLIEAHDTLRAMIADAIAGAPTPRSAHQSVLDRVAAVALAGARPESPS